MANKSPCPDVVIVSEPSTFYWNSVLTILKKSGASLVIDVMDLWPEMFGIALPRILRSFQHIIFSPLYLLRARKFMCANAIIAVSNSYAELSKVLAPQLLADKIKTVY